MSESTAIVTGANKGLGFGVSEALARQGYKVLMVGRNKSSLEDASELIKQRGLNVEVAIVDLGDAQELIHFSKSIEKKWPQVSILVNNAGVLLESEISEMDNETNTLLVSRTMIEDSFAINTLAPFELMKSIIPLMKKNNYGRIVNVSSGMGSLNEMTSGWPAYRSSKAALNALTKVFSHEVHGFNIKVNSICPGWVRTDMGGENATRTIEEGIQGIIWAATLDEEGPSGGFYRDGKSINW